MSDKAHITIEFDREGNSTLKSGDLSGFKYITILQALASSSRAFIDQTATGDKNGPALQEFLATFLDDIDVTDSRITRNS